MYRLKKVVECTILQRINRFVVEVLINNEAVKAHITNTGRLQELLIRGRKGYCISINGRKLRYRLIAIEERSAAALIDTRLQEKFFEYLVENRVLKWLKGCRIVRRNPMIKTSIIDYLLECRNRYIPLEVKSAVLRVEEKYAGYPDCPTEGGRKQIRDLVNHVEDGGEAYLVFIAGLPDIIGFKPYRLGDPIVADLIKEAYEKGVYLKALNLYYKPREKTIYLEKQEIPVILD